MYRVPQAGPWWLAVGARLERGVRLHLVGCDSVVPLKQNDGLSFMRSLPLGSDITVALWKVEYAERALWINHQVRANLKLPKNMALFWRDPLKRMANICDRKFDCSPPNQLAQSLLVQIPKAGSKQLASVIPDFRQRQTCDDLRVVVHATLARWSFVKPNVRGKLAPTAGRQAQATENVHRTCGSGLVACRWCSA